MKPRIGLISDPVGRTPGGKPIVVNHLRFLSILKPISAEIFFITGNFPEGESPAPKIHLINIRGCSRRRHITTRLLKFIWIQLSFAFHLIPLRRKIDVVVFYHGGMILTLPVIMAWLLRMKTLVIVTGSMGEGASYLHRNVLFGFGGRLFRNIAGFLTEVNFKLCDRIGILLESEKYIDSLGLGKYVSKIVLFGNVFIDTELFAMERRIDDRQDIIGYAGRLSLEKGCLEFVRSIPLILASRPECRFYVVGDGFLMDELKKELESNGCLDKVIFTGWVSRERLAELFNEMKVHVLPSHTEAFGGTGLEAMSCGAISIVNSVGGLPAVVREGETGFLLESNSPDRIAKKALEVLLRPDLEEIQKKARKYVEDNISYEKAVEKCRVAFHELLS